MAKEYSEEAVQTLDALTHIRLRSGMYIGRLGDGSHPDDGIYVLLKEAIDNSVDEFIMGHGTEIVITIEKNLVRVRDFGRGIPLGKVIDCVSRINTGAKYNDDVFQFSVGLNGVGLKAVNALSSHFTVMSFREGQCQEAHFERGELVKEKRSKSKEPGGTLIEFTPDTQIFKKFHFDDAYIQKRLWHYACLNHGLTLSYNNQKIRSEKGLLDLLDGEVKEERLYEPFTYQSKMFEFALLHTNSYGENYYSFVNGQYTSDGGTHLTAFKEAILKAVNEYSKKSFQGLDVREGVFGAVAIKIKDPIFESQTKNKLGNTEIRSTLVQQIKEVLLKMLYEDPERAKVLVDRVTFNEKLRKELASVKKEAAEKQKKISFKIPKLRDCKFHLTDDNLKSAETMIFLTEGESASASIIATRDPLTQAVFSLRGKPLNVHGMKQDQLYKNEEMYNLMKALDIEDDIANLRYQKVILGTDADVDGMHIRNLLMTFFLTYFEPLVLQGHLFILQTPIFKVRNKDKTIYCYSDEERAKAVEKLKSPSLEITRFKGLGEISPHEFKAFIGPDIRLKMVQVETFSDIKPTLEFYMGKNTPDRKEFIMKNLITEAIL